MPKLRVNCWGKKKGGAARSDGALTSKPSVYRLTWQKGTAKKKREPGVLTAG